MNVHCNTLFILDGIKILVKKKKKTNDWLNDCVQWLTREGLQTVFTISVKFGVTYQQHR